MTLKDLLSKRMRTERYRPSDLACSLNRSRAAVSLTLNRPIDQLRVSTLKNYLEAVGLSFNPENLVNK
jgi:hypothetical protein